MYAFSGNARNIRGFSAPPFLSLFHLSLSLLNLAENKPHVKMDYYPRPTPVHKIAHVGEPDMIK